MTKTISLADDAYEALHDAKRPGESFSDVARRLARKDALDELLDPDRPPLFTKKEADGLLRDVRRWRDESLEPRA